MDENDEEKRSAPDPQSRKVVYLILVILFGLLGLVRLAPPVNWGDAGLFAINLTLAGCYLHLWLARHP